MQVMTYRGTMLIALIFLATYSANARSAEPMPDRPLPWTVLGTASGPMLSAERSQPANLMVVGSKPWLIDCGDGALERLSAVGYQPGQVDVVFISHLHLDHIGGLQGLIGLRWMRGNDHVLTIYGPPGIEQVVAGLLQSLQPSFLIVNSAGPQGAAPPTTVRVVTIQDGADLVVGGVHVRAVRNAHFDKPAGHSLSPSTQSLSFRFDKDGYAVGYTGDTGPSDAVARLENGVDLLVSEVIDIPGILGAAKVGNPNMAAGEAADLLTHLETQHLTPANAGRMATAAHAKRLVLTHLAVVGPTAAIEPTLLAGVHTTFDGDVAVAHDLDLF